MNNPTDDFLSFQKDAQCGRPGYARTTQPSSRNFSNAGFSLIEVCILLIIFSLILTPTVYMLNLYYQRYKEATTQQAVDTASSALMKYALKFGRYPLPADPSLAPGNPNFGREAAVPAAWLNCQTGTTAANAICQTTTNTYPAATSPPVLIGAVPFAAIGVPVTSVMDENSNFLTYAVSASLTNATTFNENAGAVEVQNAAGQSIFFVDGNLDNADDFTMPRAHFVVVSNGADGRGAYSVSGGVATACGVAATNGVDVENCNRDGLFRSNADPLSLKRQVALAAGAAHFDDLVFATNSTSSGLWSNTPVSGTTAALGIRDRLGGNVAIGDCGGRTPCVPVSKLDVYGSVRVSGQVKAYRFKGRGPDAQGTAWYAVDDPGKVEDGNAATRDGRCTSATACPTTTATGWGGANDPPFLMPSTIGGTPPDLDVSSPYYVDDTAGTHGAFFRGNGIKCPANMAMTGVFDNDEACNSTSKAPPSSITQTGSCTILGQYAKGVAANGSIICGYP